MVASRRDLASSWSFASALAAVAAGEKPTDVVSSLQFKIARQVRQRQQRGIQLLTESVTAADEAAAPAAAEDTPARKRARPADSAPSAAATSSTPSASASAASLAARDAVAMSRAAAAALSAADAKSFDDLNLSRPLLAAVKQLGWTAPTPIQARAVPIAMSGRDVLGSAVTGSGKTGAFLLPVLERLLFRDRRLPVTRVLIVLPTRELATQCFEVCRKLSAHTDVRSALVVGGMSLPVQAAELRTRPDIVIGTPGRLIDHLLNSPSVDCDDVDVLVLDEADRLLDMGFADQVEEVVKLCPKSRQTLLFSATMTKDIQSLVKLSLRDPQSVSADPLFDMAGTLTQEFLRIRPGRDDDRFPSVLALCMRGFGSGTIVFCQRKLDAHRLALILGLAGLAVAELHGNLTQRQRLEALEAFREGRAGVLVATDVAGRGLDIRGVRTVINADMPRDLTTYVHRVGRTARAGMEGRAITLVGERSRVVMKEAVKRAKRNVKSRALPPGVLEEYREIVEGMRGDITAILDDERVEREARAAETEATRAQNMVLHEDEIHSRPARQWVMSERQKTMIRRAHRNAAEEAEAKGLVEGVGLAGALAALQRASEAEGALLAEGEEDGRTEARQRLSVRDRKAQKLAEIRLRREEAKAKKDKKLHRMTRAKRRREEFREEMRRDVAQASREAGKVAGTDEEEAAATKAAAARKRLVMASSEGQRATARKSKREARKAAAELGVAPLAVERSVAKTVAKTMALSKKKKGEAAVKARLTLRAVGGDAVKAATDRFHLAADLGRRTEQSQAADSEGGNVLATRVAGLAPSRRGVAPVDTLAKRGGRSAAKGAASSSSSSSSSGTAAAAASSATGLEGSSKGRRGGKPGSNSFKSKSQYKRHK